MKNIVLFDSESNLRALLPLTFTRPAALIRCGIMTIARKWEHRLGMKPSFLTSDLLSLKFKPTITDDNIFIAGNIIPDDDFTATIDNLEPGETLNDENGRVIAYRGTLDGFKNAKNGKTVTVKTIDAPQDIFQSNEEQICADFKMITEGRESQPILAHCTVIGDKSLIFIEEGAQCLCSVFNTTDGPIYIGKDAEVMEGCCLRGPIALCEHGVFKMGAKVYGGTTIGPHCKVGGEISNAVFFGYANKAHDGFLGNAVIGEWCNLGAGCVSSNLKNDYSKIRLWSYSTCRFERTPMQFCGLIMGDHSKAGIQTMFNTATVAGIGCNIHGAGFPRTFIPSFSFGGANGFDHLRFDKFVETARTVMARRHVEFTDDDLALYTALYALDEFGNPQKAE